MFSMSCVCIVFNSRVFCLWRSTYCLWQQPGLFENCHGTTLTNNSIRCNPVPVKETRDGQLVFHLPHYVETFIEITFISFKKFPLYQVSIAPIKCPSILAMSACIPFKSVSLSLLPWSFCFCVPLLSPVYPPNNLFYFQLSWRSVSLP